MQIAENVKKCGHRFNFIFTITFVSYSNNNQIGRIAAKLFDENSLISTLYSGCSVNVRRFLYYGLLENWHGNKKELKFSD